MDPLAAERQPEDLAELKAHIGTITDFIDTQLKDVEVHRDMGWGDEVVMVRNAPALKLASGTVIRCGSKTTVEGGKPSQKHARISFPDLRDLNVYANGDGTVDLYEFNPKRGEIEVDDVSLSDVLANPSYRQIVETALSVITGEANAPKKEYTRHPLPEEIITQELAPEKMRAAALKLLDADSPVVAEKTLLPHYRMNTTDGDSWLSSSLVNILDHQYAVLYRECDADQALLPQVVYASQSHGTWRTLPRLGRTGEPMWHDKGTNGEEGLNLPIALQESLWRLKEQIAEPPVVSPAILNGPLRALTDRTYDAFLAGAEAETITIDNNDETSLKLPVHAPELPGLFSFNSRHHGRVSASTVPSRDNSLRYLIFTRQEDNVSWVGMVQPNGAAMLDSFILDQTVRGASGKSALYEPPIEHGGEAYVPNTAKAAASIAIRALKELL